MLRGDGVILRFVLNFLMIMCGGGLLGGCGFSDAPSSGGAEIGPNDMGVYRILVFNLAQDEKKKLNTYEASGTGFLVGGQNVVVTNRHVAMFQAGRDTYLKPSFVKIEVVRGGKFELVDAEVLNYSIPDYEDLAVLRAAKPLPGKAVTLADYQPQVRAAVSAVGFPAASDGPLKKGFNQKFDKALQEKLAEKQIESLPELGRAYWDAYLIAMESRFKVNQSMFAPTWTLGTVSKLQPYDGVPVIQHQTPVNSGNSGGPLFDECGNVVAINTQVRRGGTIATEGVSLSLASTWIIDRVKSYGHDVKVGGRCISASLPENARFLASPAAIVSFGSMLTAMLSVGLVFALRRSPVVQRGYTLLTGVRRNDQKSDKTAKPTRAEWSAPNGRQGAGPAAGTVIVPPAEAGSLDVLASSAVVRLVPVGTGSPMVFSVAQLTRGGILGREGDMGFVLNDTTVSKRHAKLTLEKGALAVEDLGSVNGTWKGRTKISRDTFTSGETIKFGNLEFRVDLPGAAAGSGPSGSQVRSRVEATLLADMPGPESSMLLSGMDGDGRKVQLELRSAGSRSWTLGRKAEKADLVVNHPSISAEHARIRFTSSNGFEISDLGSSNGTKVDGQAVSKDFKPIDKARKLTLGGMELHINRN